MNESKTPAYVFIFACVAVGVIVTAKAIACW